MSTIIKNDGRCEAVTCRIDGDELIVKQGPDLIVIPASIGGELARGIARALNSSRSAKLRRRKLDLRSYEK